MTLSSWCDKFGKAFAHRVKAARRKPGSTWHVDEMFVTLRGKPYLLWRAVDEHGIELASWYVEHRTVLVHRALQPVLLAVDGDHHFVKVPLVAPG